MRVAIKRGYAHFPTELSRECTLIGMIDGQPNAFLHSSREYLVVFQLLGTDAGTVERVAAVEVASVCPVEQVILGVEFKIDRLRQMIDEQFDIRAILGLL